MTHPHSPTLDSVAEHPLVVTATRTWPHDREVHVFAGELALSVEATIRGFVQRATTDPPAVFGRALEETMRALAHAARLFPSPETAGWIATAEATLVEVTVVRLGREGLLRQVIEAVGGAGA